ncbi:MAG: glycosyltransferase family 39 protein [Candidatus Bathyarchaeota archaeon]|nr:glycosyltransferase family 39 protein [Candidatus Bathyarchaeota archaeon]
MRLNEFDPYYQYSITNHMVQYGLLSPYWPTPWINTQQWYPAGLDMATSLPALPMTAATLYTIVSFFGVNIDLMSFCSILPAVMGTLAVLVLYLVGKDMGGRAVGLLAALFLGLAPSFLQRSALGFFDTEVPGVLALVLFIFLFLRAIEETRPLRSCLMYSLGAGATLAYFILGWGAAYYLLGLTALFVFVLILLKRYSQRLLLSYSVSFGIGLLIATKFPYISLNYLTSGAVIPVAGVFVLLVLSEILRNNISARTKATLTAASFAVIIGGFALLWIFGDISNIAGKFISVIDPFARASAPLIESVAEHRISSWGNIYFDLGISILFFIAGLYFTVRNPTNRNVFLLIFSLTSLYFASSMVRLLVIFAPAFSLLVAVGVLGILKPFYTLLREAPQLAVKSKRKLERVSKEYSEIAVFLIFIILVTNLAFSPQTGGVPRVYGQAYTPLTISASSLPIVPSDQIPEWLDMLSWTKSNLQSTTVVCAWWDYGNWLGYLGNVTNLADNTTVNGTQIENIGFIFMANETQALKMLQLYDAKYILVFTVLAIGQSGQQLVATPANLGDEGKWIWMARISGQAHDRLIKQGFISAQDMWTDEKPFGSVNNQTNRFQWSDKGMNSTVYKLMSTAWKQWEDTSGSPSGITLSETAVAPTYFKLAYITGANVPYYKYGGLIPLVALYEINYQAYYNATGTS